MPEDLLKASVPIDLRITPELPLLYPLTEFYERALPAVVRIEGWEMPEPYRSLLVHDRDMTPTLESAYNRPMTLRVLKYAQTGEVFSRLIVLIPDGGGAPCVFGAIKIYLEHFSPEARSLILERRSPFGSILQSQGIEHFSRPDAYFRVTADETINTALGLEGAVRLYGRRNVIWGSGRRKLAQVVEILPERTYAIK